MHSRIDLGFDREIADQFQAAARILVDAAVEQARGDEVLGLLQRAAQRHHARSRRRRSSSATSEWVLTPGIGGSVTPESSTSVLGCRPLCSAAR